MTDTQDEQLKRFGEAVEEKKRAAREQSHATGGSPPGEPDHGPQGDQQSLYERGRPQDTLSPRDKNSGKGKKTADKWNQ